MYADIYKLSSPHKTIIPAYRNTMTVMITLFRIFNRKHPRTLHKSLEATTQSPQKLFTIHVYFFVCLPKSSFNNSFSPSPSTPFSMHTCIAVHIYSFQRISSKWSSSLSASHKIHCWFYLYPLLLRWYLYKISCSLFEWKNLMEMFTANNVSAWTEYYQLRQVILFCSKRYSFLFPISYEATTLRLWHWRFDDHHVEEFIHPC